MGRTVSRRIIVIPFFAILDPFRSVAMKIMEAESIRFIPADRRGTPTITVIAIFVPPLEISAFVGAVHVIALGTNIIAKTVFRLAAGAGGVFPFGL